MFRLPLLNGVHEVATGWKPGVFGNRWQPDSVLGPGGYNRFPEWLPASLGHGSGQMGQEIALLAMVPVLVGLTAYYTRPMTWVVLVFLLALSVICTGIFWLRLNRTGRERENYQLGFDGERFVGEELSRLIAAGFEVYHDVPFEEEKRKKFNIDHVLVGPPGVFSIETKTRRKPVDESRGKEYRVTFDGSCLRWPWGTDTHGLDQAANNAQTLSQWLSSAVGDPVRVTPILTLPGWMVDRTVPRSTVQVLNPKEIRAVVCQPAGTKLSENLIKRICHQLDQKCRIEVE
jgi:Nuclease-related domain